MTSSSRLPRPRKLRPTRLSTLSCQKYKTCQHPKRRSHTSTRLESKSPKSRAKSEAKSGVILLPTILLPATLLPAILLPLPVPRSPRFERFFHHLKSKWWPATPTELYGREQTQSTSIYSVPHPNNAWRPPPMKEPKPRRELPPPPPNALASRAIERQVWYRIR